MPWPKTTQTFWAWQARRSRTLSPGPAPELRGAIFPAAAALTAARSGNEAASKGSKRNSRLPSLRSGAPPAPADVAATGAAVYARPACQDRPVTRETRGSEASLCGGGTCPNGAPHQRPDLRGGHRGVSARNKEPLCQSENTPYKGRCTPWYVFSRPARKSGPSGHTRGHACEP